MKKTCTSRLLLTAASSVSAAVLLLLFGCGSQAESNGPAPMTAAEKEAVYAVRTTTAETRNIQEYLEINGDVITETSVEVYPDIAGKLVKLTVRLGDIVKKGQIIAEIDPSKPGLTYALSPVKAPIDGSVTSVPGKIGATVSPASVISQIGQVDRIQVKAKISERDIGKVRLGQDAVITFEAYPGEFFPARVAQLNPVVDPVTRTKEIRLAFTSPRSLLSVGMFGKVTINTSLHTDRVVIPEDAILTQYRKPVAFVLTGGDKVELRNLTTGVSVDGYVEVLSGLKEGDIVVTEGQSLLVDGSKVRVVERRESKA